MNRALASHWPEYLIEGVLLGLFMVSAALCTALMEYPGSPFHRLVTNPDVRRALVGLAMGITAVGLIYCPWGRRSGAHMNPAVTLAFARLGKVRPWDALFYVGAQCAGGTAGVLLSGVLLGGILANPAVNYVVTVPGPHGTGIAFVAEAAIAFGMMFMVLIFSNQTRLAPFTGWAAGTLVFLFITFEAPLSGMSLNPARTLASALPSGNWQAFWLYLVAPPLGMGLAVEGYRIRHRLAALACPKLHHGTTQRCIFCGYSGRPAGGRGKGEGRRRNAECRSGETGGEMCCEDERPTNRHPPTSIPFLHSAFCHLPSPFSPVRLRPQFRPTVAMHDHYDVIIIGTGAGGGSLLHRLAPSGKRILVLERGPFLPREKDNWDYRGSFKYYSGETMYNREGGEIHPGFCYYVGGYTKVYGAALFRLRERDFEQFTHHDGISPEWPVKYGDFEPYYGQAEALYQVHGQAGTDPTEPWRTGPYPHPPISHEPRIKEVFDVLTARGLHPYPAPMGIRINEAMMHLSPCIRCDTCDGYPCLVQAKSDADISAVRPALGEPNITLLTEARVLRLHTSASGREVTGVVVDIQGRTTMLSADLVVVSCGAVNSSALLLRSGNDKHPHGLANASGQVGRNLMKHVLGSLVGVSTVKPNPSRFQKTMAINDYYWGEPGYDFPMGNIQLMGKTVLAGLQGHEDLYAPLTIQQVAESSIDWWLTTEDLPDPRNRVLVDGDRTIIDYTENNAAPFDRLVHRWKDILGQIGCGCHILPQKSYFSPKSGYFSNKMPMQSLGHQVGTCRFGSDPRTSVLDLHCRAHDVDNLYVVDGSFFVSSGAVNPTLTIIANALRVGDHLLDRLGARRHASNDAPFAIPIYGKG